MNKLWEQIDLKYLFSLPLDEQDSQTANKKPRNQRGF